jgi:hypothetical protein
MFHQGHGIGILAKNTCKAKDFAGVFVLLLIVKLLQ